MAEETRMLTYEEYVNKNLKNLAPIFFTREDQGTKEQFLLSCYQEYVKNYLQTHVGKDQKIEDVYGVSITGISNVSPIKTATKYITVDITCVLSNGKQVVGTTKFNIKDFEE